MLLRGAQRSRPTPRSFLNSPFHQGRWFESVDWQFAIEIHPPDWRFAAGESWIAGWIQPPADQAITDVRARMHHRFILGLAGLPHPVGKDNSPGQPLSARSGFSFLLAPHAGATVLQLEVRDSAGQWTEFFRTKIFVGAAASSPPSISGLSQSFDRLVIALIRRRLRDPVPNWTIQSDDLLVSFAAEPLHAHPNPPFRGALEEPHDIGRLRYGRIPVTGWLTHPQARITRLMATIDPLPAVSLTLGLPRHDISRVFPALGDQANAAFVGEIALPAGLAAPVLLKIFAELDNGEQPLVFARRFTPHHHRGTGEMPPMVTGFTFARATWAIYRSAWRLALPRHGLIRAAWSSWVNYRAIPAYRPKKHFPLLKNLAARSSRGLPRHDSTAPSPACTVIAPADDMCVPDPTQYFHLGREALALVQQASALAAVPRIESILDLPSGFGRVARWLRMAYPAARLTVSDTQKPAVAFCVEHLGATGVPATVDGSHWAALPGPYDLIWCGSLLTHLDQNQWIIHLQRFAERLSPHGILVFTSHGRLVLDKLQCGEKDYGLPQTEITRLCAQTVKDGFGYVDYPATPAYGISVAQPAWLLELIARETKLQVLDYREASWDLHQDVLVCTLSSRLVKL